MGKNRDFMTSCTQTARGLESNDLCSGTPHKLDVDDEDAAHGSDELSEYPETPATPHCLDGFCIISMQKWLGCRTICVLSRHHGQVRLQKARRLPSLVHGRVIVIEYEVQGTVLATGVKYNNRFCSVIKIENRKIAHWRDYMRTLSRPGTL